MVKHRQCSNDNQKKLPLVSVVLPALNCEKYLKESIGSVLSQDYKNTELIVVCGKSEDKTTDIAKSFKSAHIALQSKAGIAEAFNQGIECAEGELIAFQSGDDIWKYNKVSTQVNYMLSNQECDYTVTKFRYFLNNKSKFPPGFKRKLINKDLTGPTLESFMCWRNLFIKAGKLDTDFSSALDVEWFSRLKDNRIKHHIIPEVLLLKRIHDSNISLNEKNNNKQIIDALRISINNMRRSRITN